MLARHFSEAGLSTKPSSMGSSWAAGEPALGDGRGDRLISPRLWSCLRPFPTRRARGAEIDLQIALGRSVDLCERPCRARDRSGLCPCARALPAGWRLGRLSPLLFGQWVFHMVRAEHAAAQEIAEELLRSAERDGDAAGLVVGHRAAGIGSLWRGDLIEAREHLERTLALYDPERHRSLASLYVYDPRLAGLAGLAFALFQLGYPDKPSRVAARRSTTPSGYRIPPAWLTPFTTRACWTRSAGTLRA